MGATPTDLRAEVERDGAWLVELRVGGVCLCIPVHQPLKLSVARAALPHVHLVISQQDVCIGHAPALGADAASQLVEHVICILLHCWEGLRLDNLGHVNSGVSPWGIWMLPL